MFATTCVLVFVQCRLDHMPTFEALGPYPTMAASDQVISLRK